MKRNSHAGNLDTCPRLQRVYSFLRQRKGKPVTTMQIIRGANVAAVNSIIHELRPQVKRFGEKILGRELGLTKGGAFQYQLM